MPKFIAVTKKGSDPTEVYAVNADTILHYAVAENSIRITFNNGETLDVNEDAAAMDRMVGGVVMPSGKTIDWKVN